MLRHYTHRFTALGGPNEVQAYASSQPEADALFTAIVADVKRIEAKFSRYQKESIISKINAAAGTSETIEVDAETATLLDYASVCFAESEGLFDLTSGVLRKVWDFKRQALPSEESIKHVLPLIGWDKVEWKKPHIRLPLAHMELDLGGIGKEFAVDHACGIALSMGFKHALINFAGDLRAIGPHPDGSPWIVGIVHPRNSHQVLTCVELIRGALATSGDYERFIEVNGERYCHIMNPKNGHPVKDFQSVSVFADSCLVAGSATTICMLLGEKRGRDFLQDTGLNSLRVNRHGKLFFLPEKLGQKFEKYHKIKTPQAWSGSGIPG